MQKHEFKSEANDLIKKIIRVRRELIKDKKCHDSNPVMQHTLNEIERVYKLYPDRPSSALASFLLNHLAELCYLIPSVGSGVHKSFTDKLNKLSIESAKIISNARKHQPVC